jgi:NADH:ubiquinone oxidoreductase subunit E
MSKYAQLDITGPSCSTDVHKEVIPVLERVISRHERTSALIPALQSAQNILGWLPEEIMAWISQRLDIPFSEVAGVVGFYSFFSTHPRGKHVIRVCLGTACYVRGGKELLESLENQLGISIGETTFDRHFSLETGRCFGACSLAPVIMIDDEVHQRVHPRKIPEILDGYRQEDGHE